MAAPSTTTRQTPAGIMLHNGFPSKVAFALDPDVSFWEIEVTPAGIDGGDAIPYDTMFNQLYMIKREGTLLEVMDLTLKVGYDPNVFNNIITNLINKNGSVTQTWKDGSKCDFYGFLKDFKPGVLKHRELPTADVTIVVTNWDSTNKVEAGPVWTEVSGT